MQIVGKSKFPEVQNIPGDKSFKLCLIQNLELSYDEI